MPQIENLPEKAARWRNRFLDGGLAALDNDAPRPGRPSTITPAKLQNVVRKMTREKPRNATHWSTRSMPHDALYGCRTDPDLDSNLTHAPTFRVQPARFSAVHDRPRPAQVLCVPLMP